MWVVFSYSHHDFLGSWYDGFLLFPGLLAVIVRRCWILFIPLMLASSLGTAHRSWQVVWLRDDLRMNTSNSNLILRAFLELFDLLVVSGASGTPNWFLVELPEGAEGFLQASRRGARWRRRVSSPQVKRVSGLTYLLGLDVS